MENLQTLNNLCDRLAEIRSKRDELELQDKALRDEEAELEAKFIEYLTEAKLDSFKGAKGTVSVVNRFSVQTPKTVEEKKALGKFFSEREIFWQYFSVNSQSLNSFYKEEMAAAIERGDTDFKIPGIGEPTLTQKIQFRRK